MTDITRLRNVADYWREIVVPDFDGYSRNPSDLRSALHAAISLFHLADWVFQSHEARVRATFTFKDKNNTTTKVGDGKGFANALEQFENDFGRVRSVANAAKHLKCDRRPVTAAANNAANTFVQATGYGQGGYGQGPYGGSPRVVLEDGGSNLEFMDIAKNVFDMWETLNRQHGWW
jgi:hypothetical protein